MQRARPAGIGGELVIALSYGPWMVLGSLYLHTRTLSPVNTLLEVTDPTTGKSHLAQVRWLQKTPEQDYVLGCSFIRPLEAGEVERFLPAKR